MTLFRTSTGMSSITRLLPCDETRTPRRWVAFRLGQRDRGDLPEVTPLCATPPLDEPALLASRTLPSKHSLSCRAARASRWPPAPICLTPKHPAHRIRSWVLHRRGSVSYTHLRAHETDS